MNNEVFNKFYSYNCSQIGPHEWMNCCRKVEEIENAYRQTDEAVDEELEKVIITIYSGTETDFGDYEYSSGETTETSSKTEAFSSSDECLISIEISSQFCEC